MRTRFRQVAVVEAVSWLLLIVATVVKSTGGTQIGVQVLGPIHGVLFLAFVALALLLRRRVGWSGRTLAIVLVDSVLPFGGFFVARRRDLREPSRV